MEDDSAQDEARYVTPGRGYSDRMLVVVWTEREADVIRIIPARKATVRETRNYRR